MMIFNFTVDFANGTSMTDDFHGMDDFNSWVETAIKDFGEITFINLNKVKEGVCDE